MTIVERASMNIEECLPAHLRGPSTTITQIAVGMSGAGVYRVDAAGQSFVLKVAREDQSSAEWLQKLEIQRRAAAAGVAPRVVHADEARRAVLSEFVVDRSFFALFANPGTRHSAIALLGTMLRRTHAIDPPSDTPSKQPAEYIAELMAGPFKGFGLPDFVREAIERILTEEPPPRDRAIVLSHNDANPTNLVFDGERVLALDWDTAALNDPFYDLAVASVFLRMTDASCIMLLAAHDEQPVAALPERFIFNRRLARVMCGAIFLNLAREAGHRGAGVSDTREAALSLGDFYAQVRAGAIDISSVEGRWAFGLSMMRDSFER